MVFLVGSLQFVFLNRPGDLCKKIGKSRDRRGGDILAKSTFGEIFPYLLGIKLFSREFISTFRLWIPVLWNIGFLSKSCAFLGLLYASTDVFLDYL